MTPGKIYKVFNSRSYSEDLSDDNKPLRKGAKILILKKAKTAPAVHEHSQECSYTLRILLLSSLCIKSSMYWSEKQFAEIFKEVS
jgi:hypothetical protein